MRNTISVLTLAMLGLNLNAQTWQWAKHLGGSMGDISESACLDMEGNVYMTGTYSSSGVFGNDTLDSQGVYSIYITKVNSDGTFIWSKNAGGIEYPNYFYTLFNQAKIYFDGHSNSLFVTSAMTGIYQSIDTCVMSNNGVMGETNFFLSNLDMNGICNWTIEFPLFIYALTSDDEGSIYLLLKTQLQGNVFNGMFLEPGRYLAKLNASDGAVFWVRKTFDRVASSPRSLNFNNGKIFLSGVTSDTDSFIIDTTTVSTNPRDIFIAEFDTTGSLQWVNIIGGPGDDWGGTSDCDAFNNTYINGTFDNSADLGDTTLSTTNGRDWFIAKYDDGGNRMWVRQAMVTGNILSYRTVTDVLGNSFSTGWFDGSVTFGPYLVTASSEKDGFLVMYDSVGVCRGVKTIGNLSDGPLIPVVDSSGNCLVTGSFHGTADFDDIQLTSYGSIDVFVAKIDLVTSVPAARLDGSSELLIHANPNEGKCTITVPDGLLNERNLILRIFDSSGRLIRETPLAMNEGRIQLSLEQEAKGVYTATLSNSEKTYHGRIVFE